MTANLLVELLVEELPPKALRALGDAFAGVLADSLRAQGLAAGDAAVTAFASPRRLAAHVTRVAAKAPDRQVQQKLMPVAVALDAQGTPTPALLKKLLGLNLTADDVPSLQRRADGKAEALFADLVVAGVALDEGLQTALDEAIAKLPIPKLMSYQLDDGWTSVSFVRPAHGLVALHGNRVVRCYALGLNAGRTTRGHRFEAMKDPIELGDADSYAQQLEREGAVIASFEVRRDEIERRLRDAAAEQGLKPIDDAALLDEVTALVERPNVLACRFDEQFLELPPACLVLTMKANQKYFPLLDAAGRLTSRFLVVANIRPVDATRVVEGNERVVRPRLADAMFFFDQDRRRTLQSRVPALARVVYHAKLGSMEDRVERVRAIAKAIGEQLGGAQLAAQADRAAQLAKADLLTDMVGEFPELQGVMGCIYATHDGEPDEIAFAIEDHYRPRFAGDALPRGMTGIVVALADKLETLVGLFGIGERPSGDRDPFALRRQAIGALRILSEKLPTLRLDRAVDHAIAVPKWPDAWRRLMQTVEGSSILLHDQLLAFLRDRLTAVLQDRGYSLQEIEAVLAVDFQRLGEVEKRLAAVRAFSAMSEAPALAAADKRVRNILKKVAPEFHATTALLDEPVATVAREIHVATAVPDEPAEIALREALAICAPKADTAIESGDYAASLKALAALKVPVDNFFDDVLVNTDDAALRARRLGLLDRLHAAMNRVADLSKLAA